MYRLKIELAETNFHYCEIFTDEKELCSVADDLLRRNSVNNGCRFTSIEDQIAANNMIGWLFYDPMNINNYICIDDIWNVVINAIEDAFSVHNWSDEMLIKIADDLGIDLREIEL